MFLHVYPHCFCGETRSAGARLGYTAVDPNGGESVMAMDLNNDGSGRLTDHFALFIGPSQFEGLATYM